MTASPSYSQGGPPSRARGSRRCGHRFRECCQRCSCVRLIDGCRGLDRALPPDEKHPVQGPRRLRAAGASCPSSSTPPRCSGSGPPRSTRKTWRSAFSGAISSRGPGRSPRRVTSSRPSRSRCWRRLPSSCRPRGGWRFERGRGIARPRPSSRRPEPRRPALSPSASRRAATSRAGARARRSCWSSPWRGRPGRWAALAQGLQVRGRRQHLPEPVRGPRIPAVREHVAAFADREPAAVDRVIDADRGHLVARPSSAVPRVSSR